MRKKLTPLKKALAGISLLIACSTQAQVATTYSFSQTNGTFTAIAAGTSTVLANNAMGNMDDEVFGPISLPSPFVFDGVSYNSIYVSTNGFLAFGSAPELDEWNAISSGYSTSSGIVSAFGGDLNQAQAAAGTRNIIYRMVGTELVVQWQNVRRYGVAGERITFQIRLNTATNVITVVYGGSIIPGDDQYYPEVGLRGPDSDFTTNVNNREVLAAAGPWTNSTAGVDEYSSCVFDLNTPGTVPAVGTTFIWTPAPDIKVTQFLVSGSAGCYGSAENVNLSITNNGGSVIDFSVTPVTVNASVIGPNATTFTPVTINTGTLAVNGSLAIPVTTSYDMSVNGTYSFNASVSMTGDSYSTNNASSGNFETQRPLVSYADAATCLGQGVTLNGTSSAVPYTVSSTNTNLLSIPDDDPAGVTSTITVSGTGTIPASAVIAGIGSLVHTYTADLIITLYAPDGSSVVLSNSEGSDANFAGTVFKDGSAIHISAGDNPFTGSFQPETPFSGLTGLAIGTWTLSISDNVGFDVGTLNEWSLSFSAANSIASYSWSPAADLSAATDVSPVASPTSTVSYVLTVTDERGCNNTDTVQVTVNSSVVVASSDATANALCAGDSVILTGSGADTYVWSGSVVDGDAFTPAATDTYTVTGTDANGCESTATIMITVNNLPTVSAMSDVQGDSVCAGSPVVLSGGGADSYSWSGTVNDGVAFTPVSTDSYTVTGTDINGCTDTASITIAVKAVPVVTADADADTVCAGASVTLTGYGAVSYSWTGTVTDGVAFTPAATDSYTVTGTAANNCSGTATITITVNALPTVTATSNAPSNAVCEGTSVTLNGGGAAAYAWTGTVTDGAAFTPSATDTYTVIGTDTNGCVNTAVITVIVNNSPAVDVTFTVSSYCINDPIVTLGGESPAGGTWSGNGVLLNSFDPAVAGAGSSLITYIYTDGNGCSGSDTASILVDPCIGIEETTTAFGLNVFPNPAVENLHISVSDVKTGKVSVELIDLTGRLLYSQQLPVQNGRITEADLDLRSLAAGSYFLNVNTGNALQIIKVIKQ